MCSLFTTVPNMILEIRNYNNDYVPHISIMKQNKNTNAMVKENLQENIHIGYKAFIGKEYIHTK